jgi:hypothetical protein
MVLTAPSRTTHVDLPRVRIATTLRGLAPLLDGSGDDVAWLAAWATLPGQQVRVAHDEHGHPEAAAALLRVHPDAYPLLRRGDVVPATLASTTSSHWWLAGPWDGEQPENPATCALMAEILERWVHDRTDTGAQPSWLMAPERTELDTVLGWGHEPVYLPRLVRMIPVLYSRRPTSP